MAFPYSSVCVLDGWSDVKSRRKKMFSGNEKTHQRVCGGKFEEFHTKIQRKKNFVCKTLNLFILSTWASGRAGIVSGIVSGIDGKLGQWPSRTGITHLCDRSFSQDLIYRCFSKSVAAQNKKRHMTRGTDHLYHSKQRRQVNSASR